jgi:hypothetical protein
MRGWDEPCLYPADGWYGSSYIAYLPRSTVEESDCPYAQATSDDMAQQAFRHDIPSSSPLTIVPT